MENFEKLGICKHVLRVISDKKFEKPSEIQKKSIPLVMDGKDLVAGSATGSGKTLAFGAGIIKNTEKGKGLQALILTPTRELCEQVAESIEEFSYHKELVVASVYGGVGIEPQIKKLAIADIVVATPGRLLDHMGRNSVDLSGVNFLVLDEADRMWDMGFKDDVAKIVEATSKERQTLLFSATVSHELAEFSEKYMRSPVEVAVESYVDASKLKQVYYDVRDDEKFSLLVYLLKNEDAHLVMIFCNTRMNVDFVAKNLKAQGINAQAIHGGLSQNKRSDVLESFDNSTINVLVATDVAARGLDIKGVSHVYNYDIPSDAKDYVHRIGRTARAGAEGIAINILASRDYDNFSNVQRHNTELHIERVDTPKFPKIFVKLERRDDRRGGGKFNRRKSAGGRSGSRGRGRNFGGQSRGSRTGGSGGSRGPRREGSKEGNFGGRNRSDGRGREQRGERSKRSGREDGFRGDGKNTSRRSSFYGESK